MYRTVPAPPKWDLQKYIVTHLKEKKITVILPGFCIIMKKKSLTTMCRDIGESSFMPEHFVDMK